MEVAPSTQGRNVLQWMLGLMLVSVLAIGLGLQMARSRADGQWLSVMAQMHEGDVLRGGDPSMPPPTSVPPITFAPLFWPQAETRGGNVFRAWREVHLDGLEFALVVRQERSFFGSSMDALMSGEAGLVDTVSAILDRVAVELIVEP